VTLNCSASEVPAAFFDSDEVDRTEDFDDDALGGRVACLLSTVPEVEVLLPCNGLDMAFLPDKKRSFISICIYSEAAHRDSGVVG